MLSRLLESVDICKEYDIPVSVIHLSSNDNPPHINDIGIMLEVFKLSTEKTAYEGYEALSVEQYYERVFEAGKKFRKLVEKFEG